MGAFLLFQKLKRDRQFTQPDRVSCRGVRDCRFLTRRQLDEVHRPMLLKSCVLLTSFPPGVCRRTLPRWRRILPRLGLPFSRLFSLFCDPGLPGSLSSLTPLWYLHSIVRFDGLVCPPCLWASIWWTWHLSADTLQSGHGQTRFSAMARGRSLSDANRAS